MIQTSRQLKDLIRNLSKKNKIEAHILMRNYMMERFLERIALSPYKNQFILKGGMLVAALVGLDARATMDMDATIKGVPLSVETVKNIITDIISVKVDDGMTFYIKSTSEIMDDVEHNGVRVSMDTIFDGVITPLKIDISTGDAITPREIIYEFKLMFEDRKIAIWAYNLETVLAEKFETLITRTVTNTRMRDFYDIHILLQLYGDTLDPVDFSKAFAATAQRRNSLEQINDTEKVITEIEGSPVMQKLWSSYQKKFSYAEDISWREIVQSVRKLDNKRF